MRQQRFSVLKPIGMVIALIILFVVAQWAIRTFQQPGHMGVIESQSMDMTVQPPVGSMPVEIEVVQPASFSSAVSYTGSAVAYNDIPIVSRTEGWLVSLPVYPGDRVKQGQRLAQLDARELTARLQESEFRQAKATQAIRSAKANREYMHNKFGRARALVKEDVITREEFEAERSQYEAAESDYAQALSERNASGANTKTQRIIRSYTTITAPINGIITERNVPQGTLVSPGMQILKMAQLSPIRIQAYVAQSDISQVKAGQSVRIWKSNDTANHPVEGKVSTVFPTADIKSRTAVVESVIPNTDQRFAPGDYIRMTILSGHEAEALAVRTSALVTVEQQQAVWVMQDGKAHLRYVTTGESDGERTQITQGLKAGEQVIVRGQTNLQDGMPVVVGQYNAEGLQELPKVNTAMRLSSANGYKISQPLGELTLVMAMEKKPPVVGKNPVIVTISPTPMGSMKMPVPQGLSIELAPVMPAMTSMTVPKSMLQPSGENIFKGKINLMMPGLWQIQVTVKQQGKTLASRTLEVEVP